MAEVQSLLANKHFQGKLFHQEEQNSKPDVTCGHCKRELNNPYLLCCLHSVCRECLPNMAVEHGCLKCTQCGDTSTHCNYRKVLESECRGDSPHCVPIPNGPLARYVKAKRIVLKVTENIPIPCGNKRCKSVDSPSTVFCINCSKFLCERCYLGHDVSEAYEDHILKTMEEIGNLRPSDYQIVVPRSSIHSTCQEHSELSLDYWCEQCGVLMCRDCTTDLNPSHNLQHLGSTRIATDEFMRSFRIAHEAALCFGKMCDRMETDFQIQIQTVDEMRDEALHNIDEAFHIINQVLGERIEELRRKIITTAEQKKSTINSKLTAVKIEKVSTADAQSSLNFLQSNSNSHDVIASRDLILMQKLIQTSKGFQQDFKTTVSQMMTFYPTKQDVVLKALREFGDVGDGACPANCKVAPRPETIRANGSDPVILTLDVFNSKNMHCKSGGDCVEAFLHSKPPLPGPAIKASVVDTKNGKYSLSFHSMYPGQCNLFILVNGSDIKGSPFTVKFLPKVKSASKISRSAGHEGKMHHTKETVGLRGFGYKW